MKIICSVNSALSVDSICLIYCKLLLKKFLWCPKERSINLQVIMSLFPGYIHFQWPQVHQGVFQVFK